MGQTAWHKAPVMLFEDRRKKKNNGRREPGLLGQVDKALTMKRCC